MKIPGVRLIVPVLVGTMFASCSPTRTVMRSVTAADFTDVQHVVVDDQLFYTKGVVGDTLVCRLRTQPSPAGDGTRVPLTLQDALAAGLDHDDMLTLAFRPDAELVSTGDSLRIPLRAIDSAQMSGVNPGFVAGAMIGGGAVVLLIIAGLALMSLPLALLRN